MDIDISPPCITYLFISISRSIIIKHSIIVNHIIVVVIDGVSISISVQFFRDDMRISIY